MPRPIDSKLSPTRRRRALLIVVGLLVGCSSEPAVPKPEAAVPDLAPAPAPAKTAAKGKPARSTPGMPGYEDKPGQNSGR